MRGAFGRGPSGNATQNKLVKPCVDGLIFIKGSNKAIHGNRSVGLAVTHKSCGKLFHPADFASERVNDFDPAQRDRSRVFTNRL
jgi:hypothetical protein